MQHYSDNSRAYLDFDMKREHDEKRRKYFRPSPRLRPMFTVLRMVGLRPAEHEAILLEATQHGWHVVVPLDEKLSDAELVALQLAMGDDQRRGALNLMRCVAMRRGNGVTPYWRKRWNILFSGKLN